MVKFYAGGNLCHHEMHIPEATMRGFLIVAMATIAYGVDAAAPNYQIGRAHV